MKSCKTQVPLKSLFQMCFGCCQTTLRWIFLCFTNIKWNTKQFNQNQIYSFFRDISSNGLGEKISITITEKELLWNNQKYIFVVASEKPFLVKF